MADSNVPSDSRLKCVCIIQARMGASRLPGKVLMDLSGKPMLAQQIQRIQKCGDVDEIVVATTRSSEDQVLVELARKENVAWFCGSENDVLGRFVGAARETNSDVILRVTGDCPLIDPQVIKRVFHALADHKHRFDYVSNIGLTSAWSRTEAGEGTQPKERTFPRGLDVECFFWDTLLRIDRLTTSSVGREHVTVIPRSEKTDLFLTKTIFDDQDNSDLRWTVDTEADLKLIREIYEALCLNDQFVPYLAIVDYIRKNPYLMKLNEDIKTTTG